MNAIKSKIYTLLRRSETIFKTDMIYLVKGGSWLGLSQIITIATGFGLSLAFTNLLSPETYGIYKYVLSIVSLLLITTLNGVDSAVTQSVARGFDGTLALGVRTKIKWGLFGSLGSVGVATYYYIQGNTVLAIAFIISAFFIPFIESFDLYNALLNGKKLFKKFSNWNSIKKIIPTGLLITTLYLTSNLFIILSVYFLSALILNIWFFNKTTNDLLSNNLIDPDSMSFGKHLSVLNILSTLATELDKILVFHYLGAVQLAVYTIALAPVDQIKGILKNLNALAFPKFAEQKTIAIKETLAKKTTLLTIGSSVIIGVYIILAPLFFKLFFPKYIESVIYSQVLAFTLIGAIISGFLYTILEARAHTKGLSFFNISTNILNLTILFPLVYYFGIWGAIGARGVSRFTSAIVAYLLVQRMD
jgi:O-antigen/teichoic acid export membrane protein